MLSKGKLFNRRETLWKYISMRKSMLDYDNYKYENLDPYIKSKDFKAGFFAGVKIVLSLFINEDNFIN